MLKKIFYVKLLTLIYTIWFHKYIIMKWNTMWFPLGSNEAITLIYNNKQYSMKTRIHANDKLAYYYEHIALYYII